MGGTEAAEHRLDISVELPRLETRPVRTIGQRR
jgi:hypothetical protein